MATECSGDGLPCQEGTPSYPYTYSIHKDGLMNQTAKIRELNRTAGHGSDRNESRLKCTVNPHMKSILF